MEPHAARTLIEIEKGGREDVVIILKNKVYQQEQKRFFPSTAFKIIEWKIWICVNITSFHFSTNPCFFFESKPPFFKIFASFLTDHNIIVLVSPLLILFSVFISVLTDLLPVWDS